MSAKAILKITVLSVATWLICPSSRADLLDEVSPVISDIAPVISLGSEMSNIQGAAGLSLKALNPVLTVAQMELESRQPKYRDAPHVVYARGLTDFLVSKPIYVAAGLLVSEACVSDPATCGIAAATTMNKAQMMVDASKDAVENRVRAFDDYGRQAAIREATRRANGVKSLDDYPPIRDAHRAMGNFSERLRDALELKEDTEKGDQPPQASDVECGSMEYYSRVGGSGCGTEQQDSPQATDQGFNGVWRQTQAGQEGMVLKVTDGNFSLTLGKGMESCGTIKGTFSLMTADEIAGSFGGRCGDLNMKGKVGMQRKGSDYSLTNCVSMASRTPGPCSLGYFADAERTGK